MGFVDAPLGLGFGQDLHNGETFGVRVEHDLDCFGVGEEENGDEDVGDEVHGRYVIVVDQDAVKRRQLGLLVRGDFDVGSGLDMHIPAIVQQE